MGLFQWFADQGTALGTKIGTAMYEAAQQSDANAAKAVQDERDWQTEMSNTAIQRQMKDLEAAGLNKYAMFANGTPSGASVGSAGTAATVNRVDSLKHVGSMLVSVGGLANSALSNAHRNSNGTLSSYGNLIGSIGRLLGNL